MFWIPLKRRVTVGLHGLFLIVGENFLLLPIYNGLGHWVNISGFYGTEIRLSIHILFKILIKDAHWILQSYVLPLLWWSCIFYPWFSIKFQLNFFFVGIDPALHLGNGSCCNGMRHHLEGGSLHSVPSIYLEMHIQFHQCDWAPVSVFPSLFFCF